MSSADSFSSKLSKELGQLDWQARNDLLLKIGRMELKMKDSGQEKPSWRGPLPEYKMLGADVVIPTDQGDRRGRVICFGIVHMGGENWERSVIVHVPASGTQHEGPGSVARLATQEDSIRISSEMEMASRLVVAADVVNSGGTQHTHNKKKKRGQRDPKLVEQMIALAHASPNVRAVEEGSANFKITGIDPVRRIYVFKSQLRVDISGFSVTHDGIRTISDDEARDMHLGKVRGQFTFDDRAMALTAFSHALESMRP